jgi:hypothetical protein
MLKSYAEKLKKKKKKKKKSRRPGLYLKNLLQHVLFLKEQPNFQKLT